MTALSKIHQCVGRQETAHERVTAAAMARLAATLDIADEQGADRFDEGREMPEGWHAVLFGSLCPSCDLAADGHPPRGAFLPDLPDFPRRMFIRRTLTFHRPVIIGEMLTRRSRIVDVVHKTGRSGDLVFVTLEQTFTVSDDDTPRSTEQQMIVYRPAANGLAVPRIIKPEMDTEWRFGRSIDPAVVFRFSAVTFNAHRIHYDLDYARNEEGYRERVQNGMLTSMWLLEAGRARLPTGVRIATFTSSNEQPLFVNDDIEIRGATTGDGVIEVLAIAPNGGVAARGELTFAG